MAAYSAWRLEVAWTSDPDATSPAWQNMTTRVRGAVTITRGRTQELGDIQPGTMIVSLDDVDKALTAGNQTSPFYPYVEDGKRGRLVETVGGIDYVRFTGFITDIDPGVWVDTGDAVATFTFTDRLDRLQRSEPFISTLAAHIIHEGGDSLVAYYPMNETTGPTIADAFDRGVLTEVPQAFTVSVDLSNDPQVTYGTAEAIPGDDLTGLEFDPRINSSSSAKVWTEHQGSLGTAVTVSSGQTIALAVWVRWNRTTPDGPRVLRIDGTNSSILVKRDSATGDYEVDVLDQSGGTAQIVTGHDCDAGIDVWRLIAVRVTEATGVVEFWNHREDAQQATISGTPTTLHAEDLFTSGYAPAGFAHMQVYYGASATTYTRAQHLAQIEAGFTGLERQTTGERITTMAEYAGISSSGMDIDEGNSQMPMARLAQRNPYEEMASAATTENGDLYVSGSDVLVFRERARRYNQVATATIEKAWIDDGLLPRVDGPFINVMDVAGAGRTARSRDAASIDKRGVHSAQLDIEVMQTSEPANAARWRTLMYADQRARVPVLPVDLLHHADAGSDHVLHAVLSLDIGDRADLDGMPSDYPVGADKLVIEGYTELIGEGVRRIDFVTSPVLGLPVGTAGTWFKLDDPDLGQLDAAGHPLAY